MFRIRLFTIDQCTRCFSSFAVSLNEAHNVVCILQDVIGVETWTAIRRHWVEQQGAQNAALGGASVQEDGIRVVFAPLHSLYSFNQEI